MAHDPGWHSICLAISMPDTAGSILSYRLGMLSHPRTTHIVLIGHLSYHGAGAPAFLGLGSAHPPGGMGFVWVPPAHSSKQKGRGAGPKIGRKQRSGAALRDIPAGLCGAS